VNPEGGVVNIEAASAQLARGMPVLTFPLASAQRALSRSAMVGSGLGFLGFRV